MHSTASGVYLRTRENLTVFLQHLYMSLTTSLHPSLAIASPPSAFVVLQFQYLSLLLSAQDAARHMPQRMTLLYGKMFWVPTGSEGAMLFADTKFAEVTTISDRDSEEPSILLM